MNLRDLIIMIVIAEALLHYLPWRRWLGQDLPRLWAYMGGSLGMMVPLSLWLMDRGEFEIIQVMWIVVVSAGGTVFALYGLDHYLELERHKTESIEREEVMQKSLKDKGDGSADKA